MRKTILMLINGFGIEKNGSANVYNPNLMPNLDKMTKECLFGSLVTHAGDYNNGYRLFSMPEVIKREDDEIDNLIYEKKLGTVQGLNDVKASINSNNKLHVFYYLENDDRINQVREILKTINFEKDKKVFVHLVLFGTSTSSYESIKKVISKLSFELGEYCKIGLVVGKNKINSDDFLRSYYREFGERWNESEKKIEILKKEIVVPEEASVFIINNGFAFQENDSVLFLNYENADIDRFYNDFTKVSVKVFSLYPLKDGIPSMFAKVLNSALSLADSLKQYNVNLLVFTDKSRINDVNFYLNGMNAKLSDNITYATNNLGLFSSKESVISTIESTGKDGFILDFDIGNFNKLDEIKNMLSSIDSIIQNISDASKEKDYTFIISSLYGMHAPVMDGVVQKEINFSGKVPCIFQSNSFTKSEYSLNSGNTYALTMTYLTNINDEVKCNKLVHKLSKLEKMLSKK